MNSKNVISKLRDKEKSRVEEFQKNKPKILMIHTPSRSEYVRSTGTPQN